jgi:two-component system sensor histidine kinase YesM
MAWSLGRLFSLMVNKGKPMLTIKQELEHIRMYMKIQNIRYGNLFNLNITCQESIGDMLTLKLILQPIVENSIVHGFLANEDREDEQANIYVNVYEEDDIIFEICDDGMGMTEARYDEVRKKLLESQDDLYTEVEVEKSVKRGNGIGMVNIHQRIRLYYGEAYGLTLTRKFRQCIFQVKIPKKYKFDK